MRRAWSEKGVITVDTLSVVCPLPVSVSSNCFAGLAPIGRSR